MHNPYGPPLYHHSRPITTTTSDKVKTLTLLKTRTLDQNVITAKTQFSSVVESSDMETNGSGIQSQPVSKMNVPIKTYQNGYKKEIYQRGKMTEDQNKQDTKKGFYESFTTSSRYMKENFLQNTSSSNEMKIDDIVENRWRSRERKSITLRSRENISLNRRIDSTQNDTSKKSFVHLNRSHSTPRKESQIKRESRQSKQTYSNKYSDDATRQVIN